MRNQPIERVMSTPAWVIGPESTVEEAAGLMARQGLHHLPVVENERLVGVVSAADLVGASGSGELPERASAGQRQIGDIMHRDPAVISRTATLQDAAVLLAGGGYHSLPVTDLEGRVVGVVTSTDLIVVLLRQLPSTREADTHPTQTDTEEFADPAALAAAIHTAERRLQSGADADPLLRAFLHLAGKTRELENVRRAADVYLRSGQGEHEHTVLVRALEKAREHLGRGLTTGRL